MKGLIFEPLTPLAEAAANRTDLACFIGFVKVRVSEPPEDLRQWLEHEGWWPAAESAGAMGHDTGSLYDVPLPVASWERFDQLFAWDQRNYGQANTVPVTGATYLGAAVRSFFAQGGRKCYVISCGEPMDFAAGRATRDALLSLLVPADTGATARREEWHGLHHLLGLPGASFVVLPDLAELASRYHEALLPPMALPLPDPEFVDCSQAENGMTEEKQVVRLAAPSCTDEEYAIWRDAVHRAGLWIAGHRRDMQLIAALPLPHRESGAAVDPLAFLHGQGWLSGAMAHGVCPDVGSGVPDAQEGCSIASAFLQLSYPWLKVSYGGDLPAGLEPPDGVLAGMLARNALTRGTFRNGCALATHNLTGILPRLGQSRMAGINAKAPLRASPGASLLERVSLFGPESGAIRLLSDVTTSNDASLRQANINRTIGLVMRAARAIGEEYVFEPSGERLWNQLRSRLGDVLRAMHHAGALAGRGAGDAFQVRCDRSTMTRQDIDNGRVIVQVMIHPAAAIETMRVQLVIGDGGHVSLSVSGMDAGLNAGMVAA